MTLKTSLSIYTFIIIIIFVVFHTAAIIYIHIYRYRYFFFSFPFFPLFLNLFFLLGHYLFYFSVVYCIDFLKLRVKSTEMKKDIQNFLLSVGLRIMNGCLIALLLKPKVNRKKNMRRKRTLRKYHEQQQKKKKKSREKTTFLTISIHPMENSILVFKKSFVCLFIYIHVYILRKERFIFLSPG